MSKPKASFSRVELHDDALLVGARWWQESMASMDPVARRQALIALAVVGGIVGIAGFGIAMAARKPSSSGFAGAPGGDADLETKSRAALDAQKEFGWSVGSDSDALVMPSPTGPPIDAVTLDQLAITLSPKTPALRPFYVPTLFQSLTESPTHGGQGAKDGVALQRQLASYPPDALAAFVERGKAHAASLAAAHKGVALVVDRPGPESVAYAAGLASLFEPVFVFDNWPHPKGVVPSQNTLAAAATYAPRFAQAAASRAAGAPPMFVLDQNRLTPYGSATDRFDNRYVALLPSAWNLKDLGVTEVLYVHRGAPETDDLNADFLAYDAAGIAVHLVDTIAADAHPDPSYKPAVRATLFNGAGGTKTKPKDFGTTLVTTAVATGAIVAVGYAASRYMASSTPFTSGGTTSYRSGSWSRSYSSGG